MAIYRPRFFQSLIMGLVYSTLFYQLALEDYLSKFGILMYLSMFGAFTNLAELPLASEARSVVNKQLDAGMYPAGVYQWAVTLTILPLQILENVNFGTLVYWISGLAPSAARYFFFLFVSIVSSVSLASFFRVISYCTPNPDVARQMDFPFILLFMIFGGFLLPYGKMQNWLTWIYWLNPMSWSFRSHALNEFRAERYSDIVAGNAGGSSVVRGQLYLENFSIQNEFEYVWGGIGYLAAFGLCFGWIASFALYRFRPVLVIGTKRLAQSKPAAAAPKEVVIHVAASSDEAKQQAAGSADKDASRVAASLSVLPFTPTTLSWTNICYSVTVGAGKTQKEKPLLKNIYGFAKPGSLTALMGASGAGKTTLMDVIAGRKTVGKISGEVWLNGVKTNVNDVAFQQVAGYVEQNDLHVGFTTVQEALRFSAQLRLPKSVSETTRNRWVDEVMKLVGLTRIAHRLIGDASLPGLSPGQLKLVTIGVELVANPSILFLDEPTSGLDSTSAHRVMKCVRRIAATGRSVICTIHQPSAEIFFMFDRLLLLRSGGEMVYFSDLTDDDNSRLGIEQKNARKLVTYLETISGSPSAAKLPAGVSPANWMLDVVSAGVHTDEGGSIGDLGFAAFDFAALWSGSDLHREALSQCLQASNNPQNAAVGSNSTISNVAAASSPLPLKQVEYHGWWTRLWVVQKRYFVMHFRNAPINFTRCLLQLTLGLLLGIIYLNVDVSDFGGVSSLIAVIFLGMGFPGVVAASSAFPSFFRQRAVYYRETTVRIYDYWIYNITMTVVELPYIFFSLLFFVVPLYFMVGLRHSGIEFWKFFLVIYLIALIYSAMSMLWMALFPTAIVVNIVNGLFMSLFFMFGGLFIKPSKIPIGWRWFYYIDPLPKAFISAALPQFYCDDGVYDTALTTCPRIKVDGSLQITYQYVSDLLEGSVDQYAQFIGWLMLTWGVVRFLNLLALKYVSHLKR